VPIIVGTAEPSSPSLQASDLKVEVNHQPATVASLTSLAGEHLQYVLINEKRGRSLWPGGTEQQVSVAAKFLKQVISPGSDIGTLVNPESRFFVDVRNETNPGKLSSELNYGGSGAPALYDAIVASTRIFMKLPASPDHRKVIFLFCDGQERGSHANFDDVIRTLQKASIPIFIVAPSDVEKRKQGELLRQIADRAGGRAYFLPPSRRHLTFDDVKRDLAQSFLLTVSIPSFKGMLPLIVTDVVNPKASIVVPSQILGPQ